MNKVKLQGFILIITIFFLQCNVFAQYKEVARFGIADGLPSNHLYTCVEDNHGFLWITTDAGIARFDGKHFQVFTTEQGLPDNDVLQVVKENNGRIWVNCFNQSPAYFDEVKNRFINAKENKELTKVTGNGHSLLYNMPGGGVLFNNHNKNNISQYLFINGTCYKLLRYPNKLHIAMVIKLYRDGSILAIQDFNHPDSSSYLCHIRNHTIIEKKSLRQIRLGFSSWNNYDDNKMYTPDNSWVKLLIQSDFQTDPLRFKKDTILLHNQVSHFDTRGNYISVVSIKGEIDLYDKNSLDFLFTLKGSYKANAMYADSKENVWVTTIDKGMILYKKQQISSIELPPPYNNESYLGITKIGNSALYVGNYSDEILEIGSHTIQPHKINYGVDIRARWQRSILLSQKKVFTFSDNGIFVNFLKKLKFQMVGEHKLGSYSKIAIALNDSIIITGSHIGLHEINSISDKSTQLNCYIRVTSLASIDKENIIYVGSTDGMYKYSLEKGTAVSLNKTHSLLGERIASLCSTTNDSLLWIATASKGIALLRNDKVIADITKENGLTTNNSITITTGKKGQVWVGTNEGISIVNYTYDDSLKINKIQNLSVRDGLTSNVINQMCYHDDTIYAATNSGISVIPSSISIPVFDIPIFLTGVQINQRDTSILNNYSLEAKTQTINLQFSGVELEGHFRDAEFSDNHGKTWSEIKGNSLSLQLGSGEHSIWLRAIDVNGNKGTKILKLQFDIATPYYKTFWFQALLWSFISMLLIWIVYSFARKERKQIQLEKELAVSRHQTQSASINPHFIFNALNSIQHFMNLNDRLSANRYLTSFAKLIRKNFNATKSLEISLSDEIESLQLYLNLERMRQPDQFIYEIKVDESLETEDIKLPVMIVQPFVENAILHGFSQSNSKGELIISFKRVNDNQLEIIITDNGVGTRKNSSSDPDHQSSGLEMTQQRIELYAKIKGCEAHMESYPLQPDNDINPGHVVRIMLPIQTAI